MADPSDQTVMIDLYTLVERIDARLQSVETGVESIEARLAPGTVGQAGGSADVSHVAAASDPDSREDRGEPGAGDQEWIVYVYQALRHHLGGRSAS
jgi:hypothetical protein